MQDPLGGKVDLSGLLLACDGKAQCRLQVQERGAGRMTMHTQDWWQFGQAGGRRLRWRKDPAA